MNNCIQSNQNICIAPSALNERKVGKTDLQYLFESYLQSSGDVSGPRTFSVHDPQSFENNPWTICQTQSHGCVRRKR